MAEAKDKIYLDYLDKEMTIMGVLSAFCITLLALIIGGVGNTKDETLIREIFSASESYVYTGSGFILVASLLFYRQRSLLAWYYGQICLSMINPQINKQYFANDEDLENYPDTEKWLREADSWATWFYYRTAFCLLFLASIEYILAVINYKFHIGQKAAIWINSSVIIIAGLLALFWWFLLNRNRYAEDLYKFRSGK